jgi:protein-tyrosine phosphatase
VELEWESDLEWKGLIVTILESERRIVHLQGGVNFRDLGGYRGADGLHVRWQAIFRSGTTHLLCEADRQRLADIDIRTIVDLRSNRERQEHPHGLLRSPGVVYWAHDHERVVGTLNRMLRNPYIQAAQMRAAMIDLYQNLPYQLIDVFKELLSRVSSAPLPLAFNCAAGKDRTGVASALLLSALGVAWDDVLADYMLTEQFVPDILRIFGWQEDGAIQALDDPEVVPTLFGVSPLYLEAMRDELIRRSGSIENYLFSSLGLDTTALQRLRQRLLV